MTSTPKVILTLKQLKELKACGNQTKLFKKVFGESVSFNSKKEAIKVAIKMAHKFHFNWASYNLLQGYYRKAYKEARVLLREAYWKEVAYLEKDCYKARAPLLEAYKEAIAKEFAKCYFDQNLSIK